MRSMGGCTPLINAWPPKSPIYVTVQILRVDMTLAIISLSLEQR